VATPGKPNAPTDSGKGKRNKDKTTKATFSHTHDGTVSEVTPDISRNSTLATASHQDHSPRSATMDLMHCYATAQDFPAAVQLIILLTRLERTALSVAASAPGPRDAAARMRVTRALHSETSQQIMHSVVIDNWVHMFVDNALTIEQRMNKDPLHARVFHAQYEAAMRDAIEACKLGVHRNLLPFWHQYPHRPDYRIDLHGLTLRSSMVTTRFAIDFLYHAYVRSRTAYLAETYLPEICAIDVDAPDPAHVRDVDPDLRSHFRFGESLRLADVRPAAINKRPATLKPRVPAGGSGSAALSVAKQAEVAASAAVARARGIDAASDADYFLADDETLATMPLRRYRLHGAADARYSTLCPLAYRQPDQVLVQALESGVDIITGKGSEKFPSVIRQMVPLLLQEYSPVPLKPDLSLANPGMYRVRPRVLRTWMSRRFALDYPVLALLPVEHAAFPAEPGTPARPTRIPSTSPRAARVIAHHIIRAHVAADAAWANQYSAPRSSFTELNHPDVYAPTGLFPAEEPVDPPMPVAEPAYADRSARNISEDTLRDISTLRANHMARGPHMSSLRKLMEEGDYAALARRRSEAARKQQQGPPAEGDAAEAEDGLDGDADADPDRGVASDEEEGMASDADAVSDLESDPDSDLEDVEFSADEAADEPYYVDDAGADAAPEDTKIDPKIEQ
jgi:hypothetical protein